MKLKTQLLLRYIYYNNINHFLKTKCLLFAYLFGVRYDITDFAIWCKEKNIDVIEDVA